MQVERLTKALMALEGGEYYSPRSGEHVEDEHIIDLVTDLLHLAHFNGIPVEKIIIMADTHFMAEGGGKK